MSPGCRGRGARAEGSALASSVQDYPKAERAGLEAVEDVEES